MSKRYRLVVFDWEGTLSDTLGPILHCVASQAQALQYGEFDEPLARRSVGLGLVKAIKMVFPHLTEAQHEQLLASVQQALLMRHSDVFLIPGAKALIESLHQKGVLLAIASNKGQQSLQRAIQATGLTDYFNLVCSASHFLPKPSPEMLEHILTTLDVSPHDALMVGDSVTDIEMAKQLLVDAVGVDFYHSHQELLTGAGAKALFEDYSQLARYLQLP